MTVRGASSEAEPDPDRYQLIRLLGRGGFGEVHLARDSSLRRQVAIKFVAPDRLGHEDARRQLLHDARAAAALDHQYICTVYEAGETADGRGFIVMQYVDGETLSDLLRRGAMPARDALTLCSRIAEALAAAHEKGIVHRDLKPGNVMITGSGAPKLVDFGIATRMVASAAAAGADTVTDSTISGPLIVGTPSYMSPEQVQHHPLDGRSDLFALGAVLFECLTGRRAFSGPTAIETTGQVLHVHPPAPSTLNPEVTAAEDELCRRLLAKDPADRFQSANEVVGAIRLLLPDTSRTTGTPAPRKPRTWMPWVAVAAIVAMSGVAAVMWNRPSLPAAPPEAEGWYVRGTEAIREGAYESGRKALTQAVTAFPGYALAHARLAEASADLDDTKAATDHLLKVSTLVPDESRLPAPERLRLQALRAFVLRDVDRSVQLYRELVDRDPRDAGAWLDLGRAQEEAGMLTDARASYESAIERDHQYAPAHLRRGVVLGLQALPSESIAAFEEAERLYHARSDMEGETEVLLSRGRAYDARGEVRLARVDLERALSQATDARSSYQQIRAQLALSSVMAGEGNYAESERVAADAVDAAMEHGFQSTAAEGLVSLAATLIDMGKRAEARINLDRAIALAEKAGGPRAAVRARVQLASMYQTTSQPAEALRILDSILPSLEANHLRRLQLTALTIAARAHQRLDELDQARQISADGVRMAELVKDDEQVAVASANLANALGALGDYPRALQLRERAEGIRRKLDNRSSLPFDLTNHADVLIVLGRTLDAARLFAELDAGVAAGIQSYKGRERRATFLRAQASAIALRCDDTLRLLDPLLRAPLTGSGGLLGPAIAEFCGARVGRKAGAAMGGFADAEAATAREARYWLAAAALRRHADSDALAEAQRGLAQLGAIPNDELRWRLASVAAVAARRQGDARTGEAMTGTARDAFERLRSAWKQDFGSYESRPDLADLRNLAARN